MTVFSSEYVAAHMEQVAGGSTTPPLEPHVLAAMCTLMVAIVAYGSMAQQLIETRDPLRFGPELASILEWCGEGHITYMEDGHLILGAGSCHHQTPPERLCHTAAQSAFRMKTMSPATSDGSTTDSAHADLVEDRCRVCWASTASYELCKFRLQMVGLHLREASGAECASDDPLG
eukprot:CAMPEP_0178451830 /NCGR_PEP_ID=MMETSP0689_2-20121128/43906_1 /TAXON_ID=160604 /ORGANISM="Amphidinium massartii, Strain CS-259" /LENGTH=174 /DNA_ID=CAMNT_0020077467 /DNA_START=20 /DNA_END=541 /DNA_ORIENTATION=+